MTTEATPSPRESDGNGFQFTEMKAVLELPATVQS